MKRDNATDKASGAPNYLVWHVQHSRI